VSIDARGVAASLCLLVSGCHAETSGLAMPVSSVDGQVVGNPARDAQVPRADAAVDASAATDATTAPNPAPPVCSGRFCECAARDDCDIDCAQEGCDVACHDVKRCDTSCGRSCTGRCDRTEGCVASCGAACVFGCSNTQRCALSCGENCQLSCQGLGECEARVAAASVVLCQDVGVCKIVCTGACRLRCERVGVCEVVCEGAGLVPTDGESERGCRAR
jgi:hypothetical protein